MKKIFLIPLIFLFVGAAQAATSKSNNGFGITAESAFGGITLSWTYPAEYVEFKQMEVYRHTTSTLPENSPVYHIVSSRNFYDPIPYKDSNTYYYWLRVVFPESIGPFIGPVTAQAMGSISDIMGAISNDISNSPIGTALETPITGLVPSFASSNEATEITKTSATATTFKFTATLNSPLTTGNKVKIDFGKGGLKAMTCSAKTCTLSSNALPKGVSTATYKIGIYDAKNVLQGSTSDGTYVITSNSSAPVSNYIKPNLNYTKIANDGSELPDSAKLGSKPKDWACTKDNKTDLIWEVKNRDRSLRDWNKTYTWDESVVFVTSVNSQTLCGKNDWRMPSEFELSGIVKSGETNPSIDTTYFPNTQNYFFWSSSSREDGSYYQWKVVSFNGDYNDWGRKNIGYYVRLVR